MQNQKTPLDEFIYEISDIDDLDYGDFMRKANHALIILMDKIYDKSSLQVKNLLEDLKYNIQFMPNWDVELTKEKTFSIVREIKKTSQNYPQNQPTTAQQ